jgi:hypothetical protein
MIFYFVHSDLNGNFKPINNNKFYLLNLLDRFNIFIAVDGTFGLLVTSTYTDVSNKVP